MGASGPVVATTLKVKLPYVGVCRVLVLLLSLLLPFVARVLLLLDPPRRRPLRGLISECVGSPSATLLHERAKGGRS